MNRAGEKDYRKKFGRVLKGEGIHDTSIGVYRLTENTPEVG